MECLEPYRSAIHFQCIYSVSYTHLDVYKRQDVSKMTTITVEALVRSDDWVAKRDNALSSVFGIEGNFLIRIGDVYKRQVQL